jgi:hypothetical protein
MLKSELVNASRGLRIQQKVVHPHTGIRTIATPDKFLYVLPAMIRTEKINCKGNNFSKSWNGAFLLVSDDGSHWTIDARMDACGEFPKPGPAVLILIAKHNCKANWKCVPVGRHTIA